MVGAPAATAGDEMTEARGLTASGQKAFEILGNTLYNLAVVDERSHDVTPEPERLRRARVGAACSGFPGDKNGRIVCTRARRTCPVVQV